MNLVIIAVFIILAIIIYCYSQKEGWYATTTYVNTPSRTEVVPMEPNTWWGGNYYYRLNWFPWGYHRPGYYHRRGPIINPWVDSHIRGPYARYSALPYLEYLDAAQPIPPAGGTNATAPIPVGNAVPIDTINESCCGGRSHSDSGPFGPMLTSLKSAKDYQLGQWVHAGTAYTDNPNDFTYLQVYQLNLDPGRDLFQYAVKMDGGQTVPINLRQNHKKLEDGDRFKVQGMEGKGDFVFSQADKYNYVYL